MYYRVIYLIGGIKFNNLNIKETNFHIAYLGVEEFTSTPKICFLIIIKQIGNIIFMKEDIQ
jgi:hypothetical protein